MRPIIYLISLLLLAACVGEKSQQQVENESTATQHAHHAPHEGAANAYMHQSSTEELVAKFESKARDEYQKPEEVITFLGDLSDKTIVDIGSGSGYFSVKLAQKAKQVIAADVDQGFLDYLKARVEKENIPNIVLRKIPYDSPALQDGEVDMIFVVNTYHHIENRVEYFAKAKQGLKDQGELVIIDFFKTESPVGPPIEIKVAIDEVIAELKQSGYRSFSVEVELLPYQYILRAN